jgi:hypothetical protein
MTINAYGSSNKQIADLLENMVAPDETILLTAAFNTGTYMPTKICNMAELSCVGTDYTVLNVHPVGNADNVNYLMPMYRGTRSLCRFDKVIFSGSTVSMANITLFPE